MGRNIIDRCVEAVAPVYAVRRSAARSALRFLNSGYGNYGANLTKKSLRGWEYHGGSAKEDIEDNIDVLRQRSRDAYMGVPVASSALKTLRTNVVAGGLIPAPQIDGEYLGLSSEETERLQEQIIREFSLWADTPDCDMDGLGNFYKLQQLAYLGYLMNGDAFALLPAREQKGQPYSLRVRVVEADRICSPDGYDRLAPCEVRGHDVHNIVQGVETDAEGMVVAYWVCNRHPLSDSSALGAGLEWTRVEARGTESGRRNIVHVITRERAGQLRGVPVLAPVLEALKQLGRYTEAEINAADLEKVGPVNEITVRINSGGGDVFAAAAIGNQLEQHHATVTAKIDGLCASAATIVACHCNRVVAADDSTYMVHPVRLGLVGYYDAATMKQYLSALDTIKENIISLYAKKTGREKDEVAGWMDATSWWTAAQAKENGFVDELVDDGEKPVVENRSGVLFVNSVDMHIYYCHPYSAFERGSNENANTLIRRWLPKGTKLSAVTKEQVKQIEIWMNNYPRVILGGRCSNTVVAEWAKTVGVQLPAARI